MTETTIDTKDTGQQRHELGLRSIQQNAQIENLNHESTLD